MDQDNIVQLDLSEVQVLQDQSGKLALTQAGAEVFQRLLDLQEYLNKAIDGAKAGIVDAATALDPNFKSLKADGFTLSVQETGKKYEVTYESDELIRVGEQKTDWKLDSKRMREFIKEMGRLPDGVIELPRKQSIVVRKKHEDL